MSAFNKDDHMCFACSPRNPIGLHLQFSLENGVCRTTFTAGEVHQGWNGCMHGGLIATLLDEVMAQWLWLQGIAGMTAEMTTRFSRPVPVGVPLEVTARQAGGRGRLFELAAEIILPDGQVPVHARAKFLKV